MREGGRGGRERGREGEREKEGGGEGERDRERETAKNNFHVLFSPIHRGSQALRGGNMF